MDDTTWEQKLQALTHILTSPTTSPSLYSQFFISTQIPCYINWDYPPILCNKPTFPPPSSECPYQQPPPLILAKGVEEAQWGDAQKREYVRMRLRRKRLGTDVNPLIPTLLPNLLLFSLLLWNPFPVDDS
ncbi:hypothetical protein Pint_10518 [Pistacia integerrima]|uniref:Uncharacterized protein n=1 Tax=Pistacia integerrima TaxID=434235 RepID=A0ACC0XMS4_9ROSI|nr:hypothetical protein Pint_10518 [Pistacia integerrima]